MARRIIIIAVLFIFLGTPSLYAFWIWTPKSGKWVNPKYAVKPAPKEQFELARGLFEQDKFKEAQNEFNKLIKHYPRSYEASESQYYLGLTEEKLGRPYEAYLAYQKVIDKYPFSERIQEVIEREYKLAESFMAGKTRKAMGVDLPVENPAIEIFRKVVENSTYGPLAPQAQYKLGLVLMGSGRYTEAQDEFQKVISSYPDSEWVSASKFQIATCKQTLAKGPEYDMERTAEAKEDFEEFVKSHPDAVLSQEASKNIDKLKEREAESNFNIGRFYEKQKVLESARIYYNLAIENYPKSIWAARSLERLQAMEKKR